MTWIGWDFKPGKWMVQVLFLSLEWEERMLYLGLGGVPLGLFISSRGDFCLCLGHGNEGTRTEGITTLIVLLGLLLIARLEWWSVLLGLVLLWGAEFSLQEEQK